MNSIKHRVAAGVKATALTDRVELASGRERRKQLVPMRVQTLSVLIPLRGSRGFAFRDRSRHATGYRGPTRVLEDGGQPQDLAGAHRRLRIMGSQVSILCVIKVKNQRTTFANISQT